MDTIRLTVGVELAAPLLAMQMGFSRRL